MFDMMSLVPLTAAKPATTFCKESESVMSVSQRRKSRWRNSWSAGSGLEPHGEIGGRFLILPPKYECVWGVLASLGDVGESVTAHFAIPIILLAADSSLPWIQTYQQETPGMHHSPYS